MKPRRRPSIEISNPGKVFYPGGKFTKADVIDYYRRVASFLLPHFRNRPVTLKRYPNGVFGEFFYEKDAPGFTPKWVKTFPVPRHEGGPDINYIIINDVPTLEWAANMAALELHPFLHLILQIERPTHVVFDLDPGEGTNILECAEVALLLREVLNRLRLKAFPKVSGSKGDPGLCSTQYRNHLFSDPTFRSCPSASIRFVRRGRVHSFRCRWNGAS